MRDEISRKSVQDAFWVKPGIAYIKILSFSETTSREMDENLKRLGENNIKGLVLDLRENPGGLLNEGVAVADHFLPKGQLIVSHHGRSAPEKAYIARNGNHGRDYSDGGAGEPLLGFGRRDRFRRAAGSRPRLDSGRDHLRQGPGADRLSAAREHRAGADHGALLHAQRPPDPARLQQQDRSTITTSTRDENARNPLDVKMTDSGRTVYGGGGITPDEKYEIAQAGPPADRTVPQAASSTSPAPTSASTAPTCPRAGCPTTT